ncbi:MAG TPA: sarcosine oxidase subunit gamma family protein [Casimicrobiaceae bacterium]|nr:sarcosine oxidase subunit gamma family protein [Casimicrobiaceae bacterium]
MSRLVLGEATIAAAWNAQGDPSSPSFADAARSVAGLTLPVAPNTAASGEHVSALWLGPASWLLIAGSDSALGDYRSARDALQAAGGALFDVSQSRVAYVVAGERAAGLLASGCPLDFHPQAFPVGGCRQSVFGRVPALYYRSERPGFIVLVARSFARDVWQTLCATGAQHDHVVAAPAAWPARA